MYKSLTKTKQKYSEIEAHETLKRVASANAIIKHYKSYSCEGRIEKSVPRDHLCHHSASLVMPNGDHRDGFF